MKPLMKTLLLGTLLSTSLVMAVPAQAHEPPHVRLNNLLLDLHYSHFPYNYDRHDYRDGYRCRDHRRCDERHHHRDRRHHRDHDRRRGHHDRDWRRDHRDRDWRYR
ncbi:MAG: hypothetical protein P8171_15480 [Candidatus Thiodiazotropha sp.]